MDDGDGDFSGHKLTRLIRKQMEDEYRPRLSLAGQTFTQRPPDRAMVVNRWFGLKMKKSIAVLLGITRVLI